MRYLSPGRWQLASLSSLSASLLSALEPALVFPPPRPPPSRARLPAAWPALTVPKPSLHHTTTKVTSTHNLWPLALLFSRSPPLSPSPADLLALFSASRAFFSSPRPLIRPSLHQLPFSLLSYTLRWLLRFTMDRARRAAAPSRRKPLAGSASPQPALEASMDRLQSPPSPLVPSATNASSPRSRRGSKATQQHAFVFSTPGPNRPQPTKKRSRTMDGFADDDSVDDGSPVKGGHSLRKRARVDYTLEHIDEVTVPNSTMAASSSRAKKRKSDNTDASDQSLPTKKRGNSLGADAPSALRRNPARRSAETKVHDQDDDIRDVIEVGVSFSDVDESDLSRPSHASNSSAEQSAKAEAQLLAMESHDQKPDAGSDDNSEKAFRPVSVVDEDASAQKEAPQTPRRQDCLGSHKASSPIESESALNSTQDAQPSIPDPQKPAESAESRDDHQSSPVADADDLSTPQKSAIEKENSPDGTSPSLKAQEEKPSAQDLALPTNPPRLVDQPGRLDDATAPAAAQEPVHPNTEAAGTAFQDAFMTEEPKPYGEQDLDSFQDTASKMESTAHGSQECETSFSQPPTITVSDASQPSDLSAISAPSDGAPSAASNGPSVQVLASEGSQASHQSSIRLEDQDATLAGVVVPPAAEAGEDRRWAHLSPYLDHEYDYYPEKDAGPGDQGADGQAPENKEDRSNHGSAATVEKSESSGEDVNSEAGDALGQDPLTTALGTPARGSPDIESNEPTTMNSPTMAAGEEASEVADGTESQQGPVKSVFYKYRKIRNPADFAAALQNHRQMSTQDLYNLLDVVNAAMREWKYEFQQETNSVADWENAARRQEADARYESKTRDLNVPGLVYEDPEFTVKGYKSKQKETDSSAENRWLQGQDRIMAASYFFLYDPHPSKIGRQEFTDCSGEGVTTRSRSLRNQPKQSAKASEADDVILKPKRKLAQYFDSAAQQPSRSGTPPSTRTGKRRNGAAANEPQHRALSGNSRAASTPEADEPSQRKGRARRGRILGAKEAVFNATEGSSLPSVEAPADQGKASAKFARVGGKKGSRRTELTLDDEADAEPAKQQRRRHVLTLKIPKSKSLSEPPSAITDNDDSRPSTASSDSFSYTAESSYSFRPKRQKRFRDEPEDDDVTDQQLPPKKRGKRVTSQEEGLAKDGAIGGRAGHAAAATTAGEAGLIPAGRKLPKIKVISKTAANRNGTAASQSGATGDAEERPKDYKSMTKSEKMSASMKSKRSSPISSSVRSC